MYFRNSSSEQIRTVVEIFWEGIVRDFERSGFSQPRNVTKIVIDPSWHDSCRHYAGARTDGKQLVVAPQILDLSEEKTVAILAHEAGHITDFLCPGRFFYRTPGRVRLRRGFDVVAHTDPDEHGRVFVEFKRPSRKNFNKHILDWKERSDDEVENVADSVVLLALGKKVLYDGPPGCKIQNFTRGVSRPLNLS